MQALINHITTLKVDGAILVFLSGWNIIFSLYKYLLQRPAFGW